MIKLHPDFKDFLRLLNFNKVRYLLVGGYAVGYYGYPRATGDMDIWIAVDYDNAEKTATTLIEFGMSQKEVTKELFLEQNKVVRMGFSPVRIEIITGASGVVFEECYSRRKTVAIDDIEINILSLEDLKINKQASGRHKDLDDLEHLP
jgi:predicted nucleotidyltransferase